MRCGKSRSTNRSSLRSSQDRILSILASPSPDNISPTHSSFLKSPLIRSESIHLDRFDDTAHFRASCCSETSNEIVRPNHCEIHRLFLVWHGN
jgi:hypothetical protein